MTQEFLTEFPEPFDSEDELMEALESSVGEVVILAPGEEPSLERDDEEAEEDMPFVFATVKDDALIKLVQITNPNAQYDGYSRGGRWASWIKTLNAGTEDLEQPTKRKKAQSITAGQIDWATMEATAACNAAATWDACHAIIDAHQLRPSMDGLIDPTTLCAMIEDNDIDADHDLDIFEWRRIVALFTKEGQQSATPSILWAVYHTQRDAYIASKKATPIVPDAIVHEGRWYNAMAVDVDADLQGTTYPMLATRILRNLPAHTPIHVLDCRI